MSMRHRIAAVAFALAVSVPPAGAQPPAQELDQNWVNVCPGAVPGTPYYERCQEILNAGPGSGGRRSAAASGNNLETVGAQGRSTGGRSEEPRFELSEGRFNLFVSGNSGSRSHRATDRERGFDANLQGFLLGADYLVSSAVTAGIGLSYESHGVDFEGGAGDLRTSRYGAVGFWSYSAAKALALDAYAGYDRLSHDVVRNIDYVITLNSGLPTQESRQIRSMARGDVRGSQVQAGGALTGDLRIRSVSLLPRAGLDFATTTLDPYAETDGVGLAMAYDRQRIRSLTSRTGLHASMALSRSWGVLSPQMRAEFVHEFEDGEREIRTRFVQDANGYRFPLRTDGPDRDYWLVGGGTVAVLPGGFSAFLDFQGTVGREQLRDQRLAAGFRARL
jgi:outer membrane autotransporter protein